MATRAIRMAELHAYPRRLVRIVLVAALVALALPPGAAEASAGSDTLAGAAHLGFTDTGMVNSFGFASEAGEPFGGGTCPADEGATAWWRIAGNGQTITLSTSGSNFDTVLSVFDQGTGNGAPSVLNRIICNDNDTPPAKTSKLTFDSTRGKTYLVQVGGRFASTGLIVLIATAPRPLNDDRSGARVLQSGAPATISNLGASQELGEALTCGTAPFAATTWFRWTAPSIGDVVLSSSAAFTDTVLTVYRADGTVVGCNDDAGQAGGSSQFGLRVAEGDNYLLQVGAKGLDSVATGQGDVTANAAFTPDLDADNDGVLASSDCNDHDPTIRPGIADIPDDGIDQNCDGVDGVNLDRDGDGYNRPGDCDDANPKIHPQAVDIAGNAVDEDCTGGPAPFPVLPSTVKSFFDFPPLSFTTLTVAPVVAGSTIELRCKGRVCFKRKVVRVAKSSSSLSLLRYVRKARLRRGATVEIRVTQSGYTGVVRRITVSRSAKARTPVKIKDLCLPVGASAATPC